MPRPGFRHNQIPRRRGHSARPVRASSTWQDLGPSDGPGGLLCQRRQHRPLTEGSLRGTAGYQPSRPSSRGPHPVDFRRPPSVGSVVARLDRFSTGGALWHTVAGAPRHGKPPLRAQASRAKTRRSPAVPLARMSPSWDIRPPLPGGLRVFARDPAEPDERGKSGGVLAGLAAAPDEGRSSYPKAVLVIE